jgi:hypothetical protein
MPLLFHEPPLCTFAEADSVLSVHDVVALGGMLSRVTAMRRGHS